MHVHNTQNTFFFCFVKHIILQNHKVQVLEVGDNCYSNFMGYIGPSKFGNTGSTTISTRQYCEEYWRYSPVLRVQGVLLHINACREKPTIMNRQVICSWFLYQEWSRYLPADKNPQYIGTHCRCVPIFFVKWFQRSYNGHPALLLHGPYRGTTTITVRTSTYEVGTQVFIPSRYRYSMYCCCASLQLM